LGCPVIAAKVDGAHEQLGDAAILVDPANPDEITSAIRKLSKDKKLRATLIARGNKRAKRWTAKLFVQGIFDILDGFEAVRRTWES
jgi:glycosyltransferase involved in cell wall biosynthesis